MSLQYTMFLLQLCAVIVALTGFARGAVLPAVQKRSVSQSLMDDFIRYTKYSSGAYQVVCPSPLGNTLVVQVGSQRFTT